MKYLIVVLSFYALTGCTKTPHQFICFNPLAIIQSVQVDPATEGTKETSGTLQVTTPQGSVITIPKTLCYEVRSASAQ